MKWIVIFLAFVLLLIVSFITFQHYKHSSETRHFNRKLKEYSDRTEPFLLKELTNFHWDRACIYSPYSAVLTEAHKHLPEFKIYSPIKGYTLQGNPLRLDSDSRWAIAFFDEQQKIVYPVEITRLSHSRQNPPSFGECFTDSIKVLIGSEDNNWRDKVTTLHTLSFIE